MIDYIRYVAASGRKAKCGNCGELSALAFIFLYDNGVRPLDWMEIKNGDHNFVLIGRKKTRDITDPRTWGARCVVSDPWKNWVGAGESVGTMKNPSPVGYGNSEYNEVIQYDTAHRED